MKESKYTPIILEELEDGPASIGTLKEKCGQGSKITNIRKALYQLLKNGLVEVNGYNLGCKNFNYDCIMLKKVETNFDNPIYVKGLLDDPIRGNNFSKIRNLFKKRIEKVNQCYYDEIKELEEIQGKMPLKDAIDRGFVDAHKTQHRAGRPGNKESISFGDMLIKYPDAQIFFLKKRFISKIANISRPVNMTYPYFSRRLEYSGSRYGEGNDFVESYKNYLNHLPINDFWEDILFNHFVIGALRINGEEKESALWNLAKTLTENLTLFVDELKVVDYIAETLADNEYDSLQW